MSSKLNVIERFISLAGSIVSIIGFTGISAYALINYFSEFAPKIGVNLLYSVGALAGSIISGFLFLMFLQFFSLMFRGISVAKTNSEGEVSEKKSLNDILLPIYMIVSVIIIIIMFISFLLLIWTK